MDFDALAPGEIEGFRGRLVETLAAHAQRQIDPPPLMVLGMKLIRGRRNMLAEALKHSKYNPDDYLPTVRRMMRTGFLMAAVVEDDVVRAVAGYRFLEMFYSGKMLYLDDLVTELLQQQCRLAHGLPRTRFGQRRRAELIFPCHVGAGANQRPHELDIVVASPHFALKQPPEKLVEQATAPLEVSRPAPMHSEQDPADWWSASPRLKVNSERLYKPRPAGFDNAEL